MLLQFCDKCGRPLSEGALARGEAIERDGDTICTLCVEKERLEQVAKARIEAIQAASSDANRPLAQYANAVWNCVSCGIPINALDLIEGRATRSSNRIECVRCRNAASREPHLAPTVPAPTMPTPLGSARHQPQMRPMPSAKRPSIPIKVPVAAAHAGMVATQYVEGARRDRSRPVLPIILFAIVLPMFAISVWFALQYQQRLAELTDQANRRASQSNVPDEGGRRDPRKPLPRDPDDNPGPIQNPPVTPKDPKDPKDPPVKPTDPDGLPQGVAEDLAQVERELAAPVIRQLQSRQPTEVWEGLLAAGSRRLIGTRGNVRALLSDPDSRTRAIACRVASLLSDTTALQQLEQLAEKDPSGEVRDAAHLARSRLLGKATRELKDMTPEELADLQKQVNDEIKRQKAKDGAKDG